MTTTEYYDNGTVRVVTDIADNNLESMPDISKLMKVYLPAPKKADDVVGEFEDPNFMRSEDEMRRNGGRYFDTQLEGLGMQKPDRPVKPLETRVLTFTPTPIIQPVARSF